MIASVRLRRPTLFAAALDLALALAVMWVLHVRAHRPLDSVYQIGWMLVASLILAALTCAVPLLVALLLRRGLFCTACRWGGTVLLLLISVLMLVQID